MSLRKGETLELPLRLPGLRVGRKDTWKTPRLTGHLTNAEAQTQRRGAIRPRSQRGRARLSTPGLSAALLGPESGRVLVQAPTHICWRTAGRRGDGPRRTRLAA